MGEIVLLRAPHPNLTLAGGSTNEPELIQVLDGLLSLMSAFAATSNSMSRLPIVSTEIES